MEGCRRCAAPLHPSPLMNEATMNNNQHKREPIEGHDKCPHCGSEKRLIADFVNELRENGAISQDAFPNASGAWEIPFMDLKKLSLIQVPEAIRPFPVLRILFDVCGECMEPYVLKVESAERGLLQQAIPQQVNKTSR